MIRAEELGRLAMPCYIENWYLRLRCTRRCRTVVMRVTCRAVGKSLLALVAPVQVPLSKWEG